MTRSNVSWLILALVGSAPDGGLAAENPPRAIHRQAAREKRILIAARACEEPDDELLPTQRIDAGVKQPFVVASTLWTNVPDEERGYIETFCCDSHNFNAKCLEDQVRLLRASGGKPDLSHLTAEQNLRLRLCDVHIREDGEGPYYDCLRGQLQEPTVPDDVFAKHWAEDSRNSSASSVRTPEIPRRQAASRLDSWGAIGVGTFLGFGLLSLALVMSRRGLRRWYNCVSCPNKVSEINTRCPNCMNKAEEGAAAKNAQDAQERARQEQRRSDEERWRKAEEEAAAKNAQKAQERARHQQRQADEKRRRAEDEERARAKPTPAEFDPYVVLGVPRGSSKSEIRRAFHAQMTLYHPDKVAHLGEEIRQVAHAKALELNRAYEMLSAP